MIFCRPNRSLVFMRIDYPRKYASQREMLEGIKYHCPICYEELNYKGHDSDGGGHHFNETDIERILGEYTGDKYE